MSFKRFGVMLDCSRNAVMKVSEIKKLIDYLVKMGYNALELYTEDTLEVENEPYFGYMRGRYTGEEIRSIDEYAHSKGVELIPCIQTLAHFTNTVKLPAYADIVDVNDILLIDEPKTYEFLENIFLRNRNKEDGYTIEYNVLMSKFGDYLVNKFSNMMCPNVENWRIFYENFKKEMTNAKVLVES